MFKKFVGTLSILSFAAVVFAGDALSVDYSKKVFPTRIRYGKQTIFNNIKLCPDCKFRSVKEERAVRWNVTGSKTVKKGECTEHIIIGNIVSGAGEILLDCTINVQEYKDKLQFCIDSSVKKEVFSYHYPVYWAMNIPQEQIRGRGVQLIRQDAEQNILLPAAYGKRLKLIGETLNLAFPSITLSVKAGADTELRLEDNRNWDKNNFHFQCYSAKFPWSNKPQKIAAGTRIVWSFSMSEFQPKAEED